MIVINQPKGRVGRIDKGNAGGHVPGEGGPGGREHDIGRDRANLARRVRRVLRDDGGRLEWGEAPPAKGAAKFRIRFV